MGVAVEFALFGAFCALAGASGVCLIADFGGVGSGAAFRPLLAGGPVSVGVAVKSVEGRPLFGVCVDFPIIF